MSWVNDVFDSPKPFIGMAHLAALPGAPLYDRTGGIRTIVDQVRRDVDALQRGGVDAVLFCNENDRPYVLKADQACVATMSAVVAQVAPDLSVPFGVDILWDPMSSIAVAHAAQAQFVREVFTGAYAGEIGVWNTTPGEALRYRSQIGADHIKLLFNINAEFAAPIAERDLLDVAESVAFSTLADGVCVSGKITGKTPDPDNVRAVKNVVGTTPVFANTGVNAQNAGELLEYSDGVIVGTSLKEEGITWNPVDTHRVSDVRAAVDAARRQPLSTE